jgi:hypothetical protein
MAEELTLISERLEDVPLVLAQLEQMMDHPLDVRDDRRRRSTALPASVRLVLLEASLSA